MSARISVQSGLMLVISLNTQSLQPMALKRMKHDLVGWLTEDPINSRLRIASIYLIGFRNQWESEEPELLFGDKTIVKSVINGTYLVSPQSFFSSNIGALEEMLRLIRDMANLTSQTTLLDVCCGSGVLGISLSRFCGQVIGLDVLPGAIDEARVNTVKNDAGNCEYHVGSAEEFLPSLWSRIVFTENVVCILDLPPSGLTPKAVQHIRKQSVIKRVFVILSEPRNCLQTCMALAKMPSNQIKGDPFIPVRAIPIDTQPHTHNFTLLILFLRFKPLDLLNPCLLYTSPSPRD